MNEGYRWKKKLFSEQGRAQLEKLTLVSWANRRRQELLELLGRMNAVIEELTAAVEREARKRPNVMRLMTHPGVGPPTSDGLGLVKRLTKTEFQVLTTTIVACVARPKRLELSAFWFVAMRYKILSAAAGDA